MFDPLVSLPEDLACHILCQWLALRDCGNVDAAFCERRTRSNLMDIFRSEQFVLDQPGPPDIKWLLDRSTKVRTLRYSPNMDLERLSQYLRTYGNYCRKLLVDLDPPTEFRNAVAAHCRQLRVLTDWTAEPQFCVAELLRNNVHLEEVILWIDHGCSEDTSLLHVHSLSLFSSELPHDQLLAFFRMFPNVLRLSTPYADHCQQFSEDFVLSLAQQNPQLRAWTLAHSRVTDSVMPSIAISCPHLVHLDLRGNDITDAGVLTVASNLKLQSVALTYNESFTDLSLHYLSKYCADTLKLVVIKLCIASNSVPCVSNITAEAVQQLQLCNVKFMWETSVFNDNPDFSSFTLSTTLSLVTTVCDVMLYRLSSQCKYLRQLDMPTVSGRRLQYTQHGVRSVVTNCTHLESIYVPQSVLETVLRDVAAEFPSVLTSKKLAAAEYDVMTMSV